MEIESRPKFRVTGTNPRNARVFLQCSKCDKDIKEMKKHESVPVNRAYYCGECDPGVVVLNMPVEKGK